MGSAVVSMEPTFQASSAHLWHPRAWLGVTVTLSGTEQSLGAVIYEHSSICSSLWYETLNSWSHDEELTQ